MAGQNLQFMQKLQSLESPLNQQIDHRMGREAKFLESKAAKKLFYLIFSLLVLVSCQLHTSQTMDTVPPLTLQNQNEQLPQKVQTAQPLEGVTASILPSKTLTVPQEMQQVDTNGQVQSSDNLVTITNNQSIPSIPPYIDISEQAPVISNLENTLFQQIKKNPAFDDSIEGLVAEKQKIHATYSWYWFIGKTKQVNGYWNYSSPQEKQKSSILKSVSTHSYAYPQAENGDYYNRDNDGDGRVESVFVKGYYRKDGTYVRSHYRAAPR